MPDSHAVYPGTFDPVTPGHLDIIDRARRLFAGAKQPTHGQADRATRLRRELPAGWDNVAVAAWAGLTVEFCQHYDACVIIRGVRNQSDLIHEYQLAAMNQHLGITTLLLPAQRGLTTMSSTLLRAITA